MLTDVVRWLWYTLLGGIIHYREEARSMAITAQNRYKRRKTLRAQEREIREAPEEGKDIHVLAVWQVRYENELREQSERVHYLAEKYHIPIPPDAYDDDATHRIGGAPLMHNDKARELMLRIDAERRARWETRAKVIAPIAAFFAALAGAIVGAYLKK